jgi:hypothetical protein
MIRKKTSISDRDSERIEMYLERVRGLADRLDTLAF